MPTSYVRGDTDCDQDNDLDDVLASLGDVAGVKPAPCRLNGDYTCDHLLQVYDVLLHFDIRVQIPMQTPDPSATYACFPAMPL